MNQQQLTLNAPDDARRNADTEFARRARRFQKVAIEKRLATAIVATGPQESMFPDVKPVDANGQVSIF